MSDKAKNILIIDDDLAFSDILSKKLESEGHTVHTSDDGEKGVVDAGEIVPDLILMDVKMPNMDGATATLKIKDNEKLKDTKIVYLTSLGDFGVGGEEQDKQYALTSGANGYIRKTEDVSSLVMKVNAFLVNGK